MYKVANGLSTNLFSEIFTKNEATNHFRSKSDFRIPKVRTELYGKCTLRYLGPVIWNTVPLQLKRTRNRTGLNIKPFKQEEWTQLSSSFSGLLYLHTRTGGKKGPFLSPPNLKEKAPWGRENALLQYKRKIVSVYQRNCSKIDRSKIYI